MMMIPEAYDGRDDVPEELRGFYDFHGCLIEPWDGPASISFTDGTADRRDARPQRPAPGPLARDEGRLGRARRPRPACSTSRPRTSCARAGCSPASSSSSTSRRAGSSTTARSRRRSPTRKPYGEWFDDRRRPPRRPARAAAARAADRAAARPPARLRLHAGGHEGRSSAPLARNAEEPIGSMGNDLALAVLSDQRPLLYSYFKQLFAQVTNPPIDSTREAVVMSVSHERRLGAQPARRDARARPPARDRAADPARRGAREPPPGRLVDLQGAHDRHHLAGQRRRRRDRARARAHLRARPTQALADGVNILILSDREPSAPSASPIPALLAVVLGAPPSRARGHAPAGRARGRVGRAARRAPLRDADRLRRLGRSTRT